MLNLLFYVSTHFTPLAVDAIIVGIETQDRYFGKGKSWTRKMVLLTDAESPIELEDWELATKKVNELQIYTTIMWVQLCLL